MIGLNKGENLLFEQLFVQKKFLHGDNASLVYQGYTVSQIHFFIRACSGPAIIHFLKAAGFSVSPIAVS